MRNILFLYNATQTYTNAVYEHISSFGRFSKYRCFYCHQDNGTDFNVDLDVFDAVAVHFSIRLPFDQISKSTAVALRNFNGLKMLFIQDEYDFTQRAWYWIKELGIGLVFTVVPSKNIDKVYPRSEFPNTSFISVLTGYVPDGMDTGSPFEPPSRRSLIVGYRGRPLPIRYGRLGVEKVSVGKIVKNYCDRHGIKCDIAWSEESRIYVDQWYGFLRSCRSMLGSESGSNVFDWDGTLAQRIADYRKQNPDASDDEVYENIVKASEQDGLMNQISPRVFEAISARTALVLFEGSYSGVLTAGEHFISVDKDGANLPEVFAAISNDQLVDAMVEKAYRDVIESGQYSYRSFVERVDQGIHEALELHRPATESRRSIQVPVQMSTPITTCPIRATPAQFDPNPSWMSKRLIIAAWEIVPERIRRLIRPGVRRLIRRQVQ